MDPVTIRAEHVGSLLRPPELVSLRLAALQGGARPEEVRAAEDRAILEVLARQEQAGLDVVTDGEFRRFSFLGDLAAAADGFVLTEQRTVDWIGPDGPANPGARAQVVGGRLEVRRRLAAHEADFLRAHAARPFKITMANALVHAQSSFQPGRTDAFYPRRVDLMWAVAAILRDEVAALVAEGVPYVQLDGPSYVYYLDAGLRERSRAVGIDVPITLDEAIAADNLCLRAAHGRATTGLHLCRGNWRSCHLAEGSYEPVAEQLFGTLEADRFLLEYDTPRAGGFEPLRFVPRGKKVVLGLVSSKHGRLEREDELLRRVDEAARYVPLEDLALSPQCGFATSIPGNLVTAEEEWRKLDLVVRIARRVWGG